VATTTDSQPTTGKSWPHTLSHPTRSLAHSHLHSGASPHARLHSRRATGAARQPPAAPRRHCNWLAGQIQSRAQGNSVSRAQRAGRAEAANCNGATSGALRQPSSPLGLDGDGPSSAQAGRTCSKALGTSSGGAWRRRQTSERMAHDKQRRQDQARAVAVGHTLGALLIGGGSPISLAQCTRAESIHLSPSDTSEGRTKRLLRRPTTRISLLLLLLLWSRSAVALVLVLVLVVDGGCCWGGREGKGSAAGGATTRQCGPIAGDLRRPKGRHSKLVAHAAAHPSSASAVPLRASATLAWARPKLQRARRSPNRRARRALQTLRETQAEQS